MASCTRSPSRSCGAPPYASTMARTRARASAGNAAAMASTTAVRETVISRPDDLLAAIAVEEAQRARRAVGAELHVGAAAVADQAHAGAFLGRGELHCRPASRIDQAK